MLKWRYIPVLRQALDFRIRTSLPSGQAGDMFLNEFWVTGK